MPANQSLSGNVNGSSSFPGLDGASCWLMSSPVALWIISTLAPRGRRSSNSDLILMIKGDFSSSNRLQMGRASLYKGSAFIFQFRPDQNRLKKLHFHLSRCCEVCMIKANNTANTNTIARCLFESGRLKILTSFCCLGLKAEFCCRQLVNKCMFSNDIT